MICLLHPCLGTCKNAVVHLKHAHAENIIPNQAKVSDAVAAFQAQHPEPESEEEDNLFNVVVFASVVLMQWTNGMDERDLWPKAWPERGPGACQLLLIASMAQHPQASAFCLALVVLPFDSARGCSLIRLFFCCLF